MTWSFFLTEGFIFVGLRGFMLDDKHEWNTNRHLSQVYKGWLRNISVTRERSEVRYNSAKDILWYTPDYQSAFIRNGDGWTTKKFMISKYL